MKIDYIPDYEIEEDGTIWSLPKYCGGKGRGVFNKTRLMRGSVNKQGYRYVNIVTIEGKKKVYVHRLVAMAFVDNPKKLPTVNHKDGNKLNNHYTNLEWASQRDQQLHAYRIGLRVTTEKTREAVRKNILKAIDAHRGKPSWNKGLHFTGQASWKSLIS